MKRHMIGTGFAVLGATRLHRAFAPFTRGIGAILMLHRVRPFDGDPFAPNRLLEIEPAFLDAALTRIRALGHDLVSMDEALRRIAEPSSRRFVALTFDDGFRDTAEIALPILEKHEAPFALYVTTGFADRTARLWWVELEQAIRVLPRLDLMIDGTRHVLRSVTDAEKTPAFQTLYWMLRSGPEERLLAVVAALRDEAALSSRAIVEASCLDWDGIARLACHPLCTIGAHTVTHPMLAKHDEDVVRYELAKSRRQIEMQTGLPVRHLAYPVGDPTSVGPRDIAIAAALGFSSAVTTRPGMIFPDHAAHTTALPRLSVNGNWQSLASLEILLSGVPFAIWNRGRRVVA